MGLRAQHQWASKAHSLACLVGDVRSLPEVESQQNMYGDIN